MFRTGFALAALFIASIAFAQAPQTPGQPGGRIPIPGAEQAQPAPGGAPQIDPKLLAHLNGWEAVMKTAANFSAEATLVRKNPLQKKETTYDASIWCLKPNMARMRLQARPKPGEKGNPNEYEAYICTGKAVYQYDGLTQTVTEYTLSNGGVGDNLLLEFMSGTMKANDVIRRFDLKLLKEDQHYIYIEIAPRLPADKAEFEQMIIVLHQPNISKREFLAYLPRSVVMRKEKGQIEEAWDFPNPLINGKGIEPGAFQYIPMPAPWKTQKVQGRGTPSAGGAGLPVARPKGP